MSGGIGYWATIAWVAIGSSLIWGIGGYWAGRFDERMRQVRRWRP